MFCDLVGSTALSRALDPEDLRELMGHYHAAARAVIERYDGHIAQYLGDGVVVYFGWPRSHGDDAWRALHAALDMVAAVAQLATRAPLAVRLGVATGLVVVGGGEDVDEPRTAVGEAPNVAARLQAFAQPSTVVVDSLTRALAGDDFAYNDLGSQMLKGIAEPVAVFELSSAQETHNVPADSEMPVSRVQPLLIGRDEEIGLLRRAWQMVKEGHGQAVMITGEAGIGKSALAATLLAQLREQGVPCATLRCSAFHTSSAMFPVIDLACRLIGWVPGEAPDANATRLEATLTCASSAWRSVPARFC